MSEFDKIIGPLLIGIFLNTYFFGLVMFQYASYSNRKFTDPYWIKWGFFVAFMSTTQGFARLPVGFLFLVDAFNCIASVYMTWTYCVENFINPSIFAAGFWAATYTPICTAVSGLFAHLFLGHRFFRLTGNQAMYTVFIALAVVVFGLAMSTGVWGIIKPVSMIEIVAQSSPIYRYLVISWLVVQAALELLLAGSLGPVLFHCKPAFMCTEPNHRRAFRGSIQIGLIACIFSVADMISFLAGRNANLHTMFALAIGPLYSSIILDTLLSRRPPTSNAAGQVKTTKSIWVPSSPTQSVGSNFSLQSIRIRTEVFSDANRNAPDEALSRTVSDEYRTHKAVAV